MHIIVFSYNRPMQLTLLLESIKKNLILNSYEVTIIYRTDDAYFESYKIVESEHTEFLFLQEKKRFSDCFYYIPYLIFPENIYTFLRHKRLRSLRTNFKKLLVSVLKNSIRKHLMFCTDDGFFYKEIHIAEELLASINDTAANTSFRMYVGQNVIDYPNKCTPISDDLLKWDYYDTDNKGHWAHTFSVDSTIYPLQTILKISQKVHYVNPNTYEGAVNSYCLRRRLFSMGLSPKTSAYFCLPINMVQNVSPNYAGKIDPMFLNEKFLSGYRITIPENLTINSKYYLPQKITLIKNKKELEVETHFKS